MQAQEVSAQPGYMKLYRIYKFTLINFCITSAKLLQHPEDAEGVFA